MIAGLKYGICPYQPAGGLNKPIFAIKKEILKIDEKSAKIIEQGRIHGPKSLLEGRKAKALPTHGPTDGRTHPLIESLRRD